MLEFPLIRGFGGLVDMQGLLQQGHYWVRHRLVRICEQNRYLPNLSLVERLVESRHARKTNAILNLPICLSGWIIAYTYHVPSMSLPEMWGERDMCAPAVEG